MTKAIAARLTSVYYFSCLRRASAAFSAAREASASASFLATSRWAFALSCWARAFLTQTIAVSDDADDLLGLALDVLDNAQDCFFWSTATHGAPFGSGIAVCFPAAPDSERVWARVTCDRGHVR